MKGLKVAAAALLAGALLYALSRPRQAREAGLPPEPMPAAVLPDLAGKKVALSSYKGTVVLLDFWATWCQPCVEELPDLKSLHEKYKDRGFSVVGISMDDEPETVGPFVQENKIPYPILLTGGTPPEGFPLVGIPTAFLVDRQGMIVRRYFGPKKMERLAEDLEPLLTPAP